MPYCISVLRLFGSISGLEGGAVGYLIVVEIEDENAAVQLADLMKYLKK